MSQYILVPMNGGEDLLSGRRGKEKLLLRAADGATGECVDLSLDDEAVKELIHRLTAWKERHR